MPTKRCLLINQPIAGSPGQIINVYGHQFIVQKDGITAIAEIDEAFTKAESKIGRYKILEDEPKKIKPLPRKDLIVDLGFELENLFGFDNINKLYKKIKKLSKDQIAQFAVTRLQLKLPENMSQSDMVDKISKTIQDQIKSNELSRKSSKQSTLNDLNDLEAKLKKG